MQEEDQVIDHGGQRQPVRRSIRNPIVGVGFEGAEDQQRVQAVRVGGDDPRQGLRRRPAAWIAGQGPDRGVRSFGQPVRGQPIVPVEDEPVGRSLAEQHTEQVSAVAPDPPTSMVGRLHPEHIDPDPHASSSLGLTRSKRWPVAVRAFGLETRKT